MDDAAPASSGTQVTHFTDRLTWEPGFSPDGQSIVFEGHLLADINRGEITTFLADGSGAPHVLTGPHEDCRQPSWSPDGKHISYQRFSGTRWDIWMIDPDGTHAVNLTGADPGDKTDATWSPDSTRILYSADNGTLNLANLFVKPITGGPPVQVTHNPTGYDGAASWSSEGRIAFESSPHDPDGSAGTTLWIIAAP
jgi:Tol biopolymer transport system component